MKKSTTIIFTTFLCTLSYFILNAGVTKDFPYGTLPEERPSIELSKSMERIYTTWPARHPAQNELFSRFKYTPIEGLDYNDFDGTVSRRDSSKIIRANDQYYVYYTRRKTEVPPAPGHGPGRGTEGATETKPSRDWDLSKICYATSKDGFTWTEQGIAVDNPEKPAPGWRSVSTPDILVWKNKYYLYYQAYTDIPGQRGGDFCPVSVAVSDSPDGPFTPSTNVILANGPEGSWDQYVIHDPYPLVFNGKIYLYYKGEFGGDPHSRAQGLAIADDPLGPFEKHPLNPVINSGHETALFPFKNGLAAIVSRHGHEHNTIQWSPDGANFQIAAITSLLPIAPGSYIPDAFTDTKDGRGITWGLCHFRNQGFPDHNHSFLARFDCDLSLDLDDPEMKETDIFNHPEIYFTFGLSDAQRKRIDNANN
ncbi:MAG: glycoside hydrolase [Verrucomicrobiota bacterium]